MASDESDETRRTESDAENAPTSQDNLRRYIIEAIKLERERLARIYEGQGMHELAAAIRDESQDDAVFQGEGPEAGLDEPPPSPQQRRNEDEEDG